MILQEVAVHRYAVYAVSGLPSGGCEVEQFLLRTRSSHPRAISDLRSMLRDYLPQHGPPFEAEERAKRLRDNICELKAREKRKPGLPRVFFFEDGMAIICTSAFLKLGPTPDSEFDRAIAMRTEYFQCKPDRLIIAKGWGA